MTEFKPEPFGGSKLRRNLKSETGEAKQIVKGTDKKPIKAEESQSKAGAWKDWDEL